MEAAEQLQIRIEGDASLPTLIYLPGLHGDWTLVRSFRARVLGQVRFVEFTYPRTVDWSLAQYAAQIGETLQQHGIHRGWLLAESFGSQIGWALLHPAAGTGRPGRFTPESLILAGGFVRHPWDAGVRFTRWLGGRISMRMLTRLLFGYAKIARLRYRRAPETLAGVEEFIARRTEGDRAAAVHRLDLILENDLRAVARSTSVPVYALTGFWDPIVPWPWSQRWLQKHCPALRGTRILYRADHTVLSTAPREAANIILDWLRESKAPLPR